MATKKTKPESENTEPPVVDESDPVMPDPMWYSVYSTQEMRELSEGIVKNWMQFWTDYVNFWRGKR